MIKNILENFFKWQMWLRLVVFLIISPVIIVAILGDKCEKIIDIVFLFLPKIPHDKKPS